MLQSISWDQLKAKPVLRLHLCLTSSLVLSCMLRDPFPSSENTLYHIPCIRTPISSSASRVTPNSHYSRYLKNFLINYILIQFSSVTQSCPTLCDPMNCSTPELPAHHQLPEFTQTHVHWVGDAIQPSHPLLSPSPPAPNPSQHQGLFQKVSSLHEVAKVLEFQLQDQSFQWTPRTDLF